MGNELQKLGDRLGPTIQETQLARLRELTSSHFSCVIPPCAPIACRLSGHERSIETVAHLAEGETEVFAYFENDDWMTQTTWATFVDFWTNREPWQDYDVCIIPVEGAWCVAISHNDRVHVVGDRFLPNSSFGAFGHAYRLK